MSLLAGSVSDLYFNDDDDDDSPRYECYDEVDDTKA